MTILKIPLSPPLYGDCVAIRDKYFSMHVGDILENA